MTAGPAPLVVDDAAHVALVAAELVADRLVARPRARLLLPTGRTPLGMYAALRAKAAAGGLDGAAPEILQLDEYAGLPPGDPRSFAAQLTADVEGLPRSALHTLDGGAADLGAEAARHAAELARAPIDLAVLGLGRDGHVAFDEPPATMAGGVRLVALDPRTRADAADAFGGEQAVPGRALTTGLGALAAVRELLVLVTGEHKAEAVRALLEDAPTPAVPASLLRDHPRLTVVCDRAAASRLPDRPGPRSDEVLIVLGHREPGISPEHRISGESRARLDHALALARRRPPRAVILTGWTSTDGLSEAEQMKQTWDEGVAPALLEVAGRNTAENASRSLPIVLAIGGIRRATVVSSVWHLRVPLLFAPYRRFGLRLRLRPSVHRGGWLRLIGIELRGLRRVRADRVAAMAAFRPPPDP